MHKPKIRTPKKSSNSQKPRDWLKYLDGIPPLVIPVGRPFQTDVAEWTEPSSLQDDSNTSKKWFGARIWPLEKESGKKTKQVGEIGKGRPHSCVCSSPNSVHCIERHISKERARLQSELGSAFQSWKFNEMGEDVAKSWSSNQRLRFNSLVRSNPLSEGKSFLKPAASSFASKSRDDIVSYYLNVYVPTRIGIVTRSGCKVLDSDDDEVEEMHPNVKNSLKRARSPSKDRHYYLTGRR